MIFAIMMFSQCLIFFGGAFWAWDRVDIAIPMVALGGAWSGTLFAASCRKNQRSTITNSEEK